MTQCLLRTVAHWCVTKMPFPIHLLASWHAQHRYESWNLAYSISRATNVNGYRD